MQKHHMKDKKKKNRLWSGEFKLKVVLDIIENELSYSQAARKYDMYLNVYIYLLYKIFIMVKLKGIKSLKVKTRT